MFFVWFKMICVLLYLLLYLTCLKVHKGPRSDTLVARNQGRQTSRWGHISFSFSLLCNLTGHTRRNLERIAENNLPYIFLKCFCKRKESFRGWVLCQLCFRVSHCSFDSKVFQERKTINPVPKGNPRARSDYKSKDQCQQGQETDCLCSSLPPLSPTLIFDIPLPFLRLYYWMHVRPFVWQCSLGNRNKCLLIPNGYPIVDQSKSN